MGRKKQPEIIQIAKTLKPPWPRTDLPHLAIAGRSNVGKSSLLNCLFKRRKVAGVSKTPGKTKALQFYLADNRFILCDFPGYGYARVSKKLRDFWRSSIENYLTEEISPVGVFVLLDGRHAPTDLDLQLIDALNRYELPFLLVLTKADKVARGKRNAYANRAAVSIGVRTEDLLWTSATTGEGIIELWKSIEQLIQV
ncbi:probable GTP-binding protein EngB [Ylistrum balloti]|uniref:probable GTP-binding protein EngB n=1 Tax=Ylistrum balloti TaxID=509963 RepID=UPI002905B08D|nr:probable GTP-binding protein EngB [Ylistrum balloti]